MTRYLPPEAVAAFVGSLWAAFIAGGAVFCAALGATGATDGVNWVVIGATTGSAMFGVLAKGTRQGYHDASAGSAAVQLTPTEQTVIDRLRSGDLVFDPDVRIGVE